MPQAAPNESGRESGRGTGLALRLGRATLLGWARY